MDKSIEEGSEVIFYDCDMANKERDFSGSNPKFYPTGKVIKIRQIPDGRMVVDVQLPDGRISKGHFIEGIKLLNQKTKL